MLCYEKYKKNCTKSTKKNVGAFSVVDFSWRGTDEQVANKVWANAIKMPDQQSFKYFKLSIS